MDVRVGEGSERAGALVAGAPVGFAYLDRDLRFVFVNDALRRPTTSVGGPARS
jgi:PAS domain-containing protein